MINIVTSAAILTDSIYTRYGGQLYQSTDEQRGLAYAIAEGQAAQEIGTYVSPTIVTGTYTWPPMHQNLQTDETHIRRVISVTAVHDAGCNCAADSIELSGCAWLIDSQAGTLNLRECGDTIQAQCTGCGCGQYGARPLQARIVYEAGLPSNAANDARLLMGLVKAAELALEQMVDPAAAEGGPGDPGVQSYSSQGYSEQRTPLKMTAFGSSARANYAANMMRHFKYKRAMKLGW